ncbi:MAG: LuxR C-terminal-related transcriptional regulator, partial [Desulfovibrionaceae bacterium]
VLAYEDDLAEFARGVQAVGRGELWYPRGLLAGARALNTAGAEPAADSGPADTPLTRKEREVLALVAAGHTNQQIADATFISLHTVKTHLYNIYRKIGVGNRLQATLWAASRLDAGQPASALGGLA